MALVVPYSPYTTNENDMKITTSDWRRPSLWPARSPLHKLVDRALVRLADRLVGLRAVEPAALGVRVVCRARNATGAANKAPNGKNNGTTGAGNGSMSGTASTTGGISKQERSPASSRGFFIW
jgi:hypothetical protein